MRVLLVGDVPWHAPALALALQRQGHRVETLAASDPWPDRLARWQPDVVHGWAPAMAACDAGSTPMLLTVRCAADLAHGGGAGPAPHAGAVVAASAEAWQALQALRPRAREGVFRIDLGLDYTGVAERRARRVQQPAHAALKIAVVGGAEAQSLVDAVSGAGLAVSLVVLPAVLVHAPVGADLLQSCDLLCVTALDQPHAHHAALQAAALGVPVAAPGLLSTGVAADEAFDPRQPQRWVDWLRGWTTDDALRQRLAAAVRLPPRVEEEAFLYEQLYRRVLTADPAAPVRP